MRLPSHKLSHVQREKPASRRFLLWCRPGARFFDALMLIRIAAGGASMAACVLGGYGWGLTRANGSVIIAQARAL
jgi:hypothetical protein